MTRPELCNNATPAERTSLLAFPTADDELIRQLLKVALCTRAECRWGQAPGEPYEGKPHVRFDEGVLETGQWNRLRHRRCGESRRQTATPCSCRYRASALLCRSATSRPSSPRIWLPRSAR